MRGPRSHRVRRGTRPTALLSSVATLLGALFLCLGPAGPAPVADHRGVAGPAVSTAADRDHGHTATFTCPFGRGDCGLKPAMNPAVLTAPPLDAPLQTAAEPPFTAPAASTGGPRRAGALPRAPDLHVLQVLRA